MAKPRPPVHLHAKVRKVGNSLAILIPADVARKAGVREGMEVDADLVASQPQVFGMLKGLIPYEPFSDEGLYDDD